MERRTPQKTLTHSETTPLCTGVIAACETDPRRMADYFPANPPYANFAQMQRCS